MSERIDRKPLIRFLKWVMGASLAGAAVMLILAAAMWSLGAARAQVLLTFVALLLGSLLMQVQLRARAHARGGASILLAVGVAVIFISQISFLAIVWTPWKAWVPIWRIWWISMVPSVFVTHLILLQHAASRRGGLVELVTGFFALWAGLMILWLGLRRDLFSGIPAAFYWIGALPATGTVVGSLYLMTRRLLEAPQGTVSRRAAVSGVMMSHLVVAAAAFFAGRALSQRERQLKEDPHGLVTSLTGDVRKQLETDKYGLQSRVAEYLGDTRIVRRAPFITEEQIAGIEPRLRPGDILLERRNWFLSNPFLPGFWPHAALYIGRLDDLKRLGVTKDPAFRKNLAAYYTAAADGRGNTVIEAVSEGVILNSLTHSLHADYAVVLRPRVTEKQAATAIARAFASLGKPYDFNFDFDDRSKLVCTQLVHVAYEGMVDSQLVRVMGRNTLPANEIARKYVVEAAAPNRQLDFVLFLDGDPGRSAAFEADEARFRESVKRPRALVEEK